MAGSRRSISAKASSHEAGRRSPPGSRMSGVRRRSGSSWSSRSEAPLGQTKPWLRTSSASPRMPVTAPSSTVNRSPQVASHSGHVLKAIAIPAGYPRACAATSSARSMPASSTSRWVTARTRVGPEVAHDDVLGRERRAEGGRVGHREDDDVGLHGGGIELDAGQRGEALGQPPGARVVVGQALDVVVERVEAGGGDDARLAHGAAQHLLPAPRLLDEGRRAGQARADRGAEALGEVQPRAVEAARPVGGIDAAGHHRVHQPRAVEVGRQAGGAGDVEHAAHLLERPHAPAAHVRGLLDGHQALARPVAPAGPGAVDRVLERLRGEHAAVAVDLGDHRAGELGRAAGLGDQRVGVAPDEHPLAAGADVQADGDLVAHRPAGQEERRLVAQQRRDALLEGARRRVRAALLVADLGRGDGGAHGRRGARLRVGVEVDERHRPRGRSTLPARILEEEMESAVTSEGRRTASPSSARRCPTGLASTCSATPRARSSTSARPSR